MACALTLHTTCRTGWSIRVPRPVSSRLLQASLLVLAQNLALLGEKLVVLVFCKGMRARPLMFWRRSKTSTAKFAKSTQEFASLPRCVMLLPSASISQSRCECFTFLLGLGVGG
jgi:hypothetical protein